MGAFIPRPSRLDTCAFFQSGSHLLSHAVSSIVPSAARALTIVFGMGTGVSPGRIATGCVLLLSYKAVRFTKFSLRLRLAFIKFLRTKFALDSCSLAPAFGKCST